MPTSIIAGRLYGLRSTQDPDTVELVHRETAAVTQLRGTWARRMLALFTLRDAHRIPDAQYNCFAAVRYVLDHTDDLRLENFMPAQGSDVERHGDLSDIPVPGVVQIHAHITTYDEDMGLYPVGSEDLVSHAALTIANAPDGPVAFHKYCHEQLEILPLRDILKFYFDLGLDTGAFKVTALRADALERR